MRELYHTLANVTVHPLHLKEAHLNAVRMLAMLYCENVNVRFFLPQLVHCTNGAHFSLYRFT